MIINKIKFCDFYMKKKCNKNIEICTFAHGINDLNCIHGININNGKTKCEDDKCYKCWAYRMDNWNPCRNFTKENNYYCPFDKECSFVHDVGFELFETVDKKEGKNNNEDLLDLINNMGLVRDELLKNIKIYENIDNERLIVCTKSLKIFMDFLENEKQVYNLGKQFKNEF